VLAGWVKMPGERDCFARFEKEWIYNWSVPRAPLVSRGRTECRRL